MTAAMGGSDPLSVTSPNSRADSPAPPIWATRKTAVADAQAVKNIESRHDKLQSLPSGALGAAAARDAASSDAAALNGIGDKTLQRRAAVVVGETADQQPAYRTALRDSSPQSATLAERAFADEQQRSATKEDRKAFEFAERRDDAADSIAQRYATMNRAGLAAKDLQGPALDRLAAKDSHDLLLIDGFPAHKRASETRALIEDSLKTDAYRATFERQSAVWAVNSVARHSDSPTPSLRDISLKQDRAVIAPAIDAKQHQEVAPTVEQTGNQNNSMRAEGDVIEKRRTIPPLEDRFNVQRVGLRDREYRFRDQAGKVAFTDKLRSISTATESPAAIKAMVDRAAERGWETVRLNGSPEFVRLGWIAGTAQGLRTVGHSPTASDKANAARERTRLQLVQEPPAERMPSQTSQHIRSDQLERTNAGSSATGFAGQRQLATAIEKALAEGKVSPALRSDVRALLAAEGAKRAARGDRFRLPVFDARAPRATAKTVQTGSERNSDRERSR